MYCNKCGIAIHPEEAVNLGMCEDCYDKYLATAEKGENGIGELKLCPFCGSESKLLHDYDEDGDEYHYAQCQTCGVQTDGYFSYKDEPYGWEKASEVWNKRS